MNLAAKAFCRNNPTVQNMEDAGKTCIEEKCECLIAFGGDSSMDCAKAYGCQRA